MLTGSHCYFKLGKTITNMKGDIGLKASNRNIEVLLMISETQQRNRHNVLLNRLKPNDPYMDCTAPLTSKRCILYIYSTNIGTEYLNML